MVSEGFVTVGGVSPSTIETVGAIEATEADGDMTGDAAVVAADGSCEVDVSDCSGDSGD